MYQGYRLKHRRRIQAASGRKRCRKLYRQSPRGLSRRFAKIADNCFETKIFQSEYADKIIQYVREKYRHELEYLWQKFPENAIVRRSDNQKWYLALLTVEKNKLGLDGRGKTEIIDLRINPDELKNIADGKKYFLGYHMNKKHWVTICLDGSVDLQEIFDRIDASYALAK